MKKFLLLFSFIFFAVALSGQTPQKFKYQAVARNTSGTVITNQAVSLRLSILHGSEFGTPVYTETHQTTTNEFGLINLNIGEGSTSDNFSEINWSDGLYFVKVELDPAGGTNYTTAGTSQLLSVPYALYAEQAGTTENTWQLSGQNIFYDSGNVGIGTSSPTTSKLEVRADETTAPDDTLFVVKNQQGKPVFAVYPGGVRIFVNEESRGSSSGFAVGLLGTARNNEEFFRVTPDSTRVYIRDTQGARGSAKGFAVGLLSTAKETGSDLLQVMSDSTRIYTKEAERGSAGGFAVGLLSTARGTEGNYMYMVPDNYFIGHHAGDALQTGIYTGVYNTFFGFESGQVNRSGSNNVFMGHQTGKQNLNGNRNVFLGNEAGFSNQEGWDDIFIGYQAGYSNIGHNQNFGSNNIFIGTKAGYNNKGAGTNEYGYNNVFIGKEAGFSNVNGPNNVFIGNRAGYNNIGSSTHDGGFNVFLGNDAGFSNVSGATNVFIGESAGRANETGSGNVYVGELSAATTTSGTSNSIVGNYAGYFMEGSGNTFMGSLAGKCENGSANINFNTSIGNSSGTSMVSGTENTFLGYNAGHYIDDGERNVILGANAGHGSGTGANNPGSDNIFIGYNAGYNETGSHKLIIENTNSTSPLIYGEFDNDFITINGHLGIGTTTPDNALDVNGKLSVTQSAGSEMVIINSNVWTHALGNQNFGSGGNPFIVSSKEGASETSGIYGDGNAVTIWSPGDANQGQAAAYLYILEEDGFDGTDSNPYNNSALKMYLNASGVWTTSDIRKKENINKIEDATKKIEQLTGYSYNFIPSEQKRVKGTPIETTYGFMAQDLEKVLPNAVQTNEQGDKFVNYATVTPLLVEGMKEQQAEIELLKQQIELLKSQINSIQTK